MNKNNRVINKYLKDVRDALNCPETVKSVYINELKDEIVDFICDDTVDVENLYDKFGTPESIGDGFMYRSDYKLLLKKYQKQSLTFKLACIAITAVIVAVIVFLYFLIQNTINCIVITL